MFYLIEPLVDGNSFLTISVAVFLNWHSTVDQVKHI